ncbi:recombinase family protein [Noviherbaspirillum sedimenti]|uniref:Recombinase family protein n=1 Tax=Noviherbaspirillum sedimenti TaxID=2320865 RepID=A0A3A3G0N5_9BURK|nr:recombinase family protein [Noviherbaspirillum sedimenti]
MATFAYTRVSSTGQTVQNQRLEIERAGYQVDYWFADEGISGAIPAAQRPQFKAMLDKIRDGETLIVSRLDRLGRDAMDVTATVKALAKRKIKVIVLQLGQLDLASAAGKLMMAMLGAVAEMERDLLIERTQAGLERAKAEGKVLGRPAKTTSEQRASIIQAHGKGTSISALARQFDVARATILAIVKPQQDAVAAPAQQPPADATPKAHKRAGKPAAARMAVESNMAQRVTLEQKHGQRRLPAV